MSFGAIKIKQINKNKHISKKKKKTKSLFLNLFHKVMVQQINTNVGAFCCRSQQILTCRSHYITLWKWPEMHVRLNQSGAQPLVQLRSLVGLRSAVCSMVSTGSQRSSKCWNQLSCARHLSLSNGKSMCVWEKHWGTVKNKR